MPRSWSPRPFPAEACSVLLGLGSSGARTGPSCALPKHCPVCVLGARLLSSSFWVFSIPCGSVGAATPAHCCRGARSRARVTGAPGTVQGARAARRGMLCSLRGAAGQGNRYIHTRRLNSLQIRFFLKILPFKGRWGRSPCSQPARCVPPATACGQGLRSERGAPQARPAAGVPLGES